jgi:transposase
MFLRKTYDKRINRTYLSIARGYRDKKGKVKTAIVQHLGSIEILKKQYDDPIAHFTKLVEEMNNEIKEVNKPQYIKITKGEKLSIGTVNRKNVGYAAPSKIYHELEIDKFLISKFKHKKLSESTINNIMKLLVFGRMLFPNSKKKTWENREIFFENTNYSLEEVYNALGYVNKYKDELQAYIYSHIQNQYDKEKKNTETVYYDLTNYYFEIDEEDDLRKKGVSKEYRPDPIVQMGLLIDSIGMPIMHKLFAGNIHDCETLLPVTREVSREYNLGKMIIVADKGINTGDNIHKISNRGNGYVMSLSIRKADKELKEYALDPKGYTWTGTDYKKKSKLHPRNIWVTVGVKKDGTPKRRQKRIDEKLVIFYSEDYAKRARIKRQPSIDKAKDLIGNVEKYNKKNCLGARKYVKHLVFNKETGEIIQAKSQLSLDLDKIAEEEKYDGYYAIVTSEYKKTEDEIIDVYRGLWRIEETFKITKSDLGARPVNVSRKDHIESHFLICYIALVITRILQLRLNNKYSPSQILESLGNISCTHIQENYYIFDYIDDITKDFKKALSIDFTNKSMTVQEIKNMLSKSKKN